MAKTVPPFGLQTIRCHLSALAHFHRCVFEDASTALPHSSSVVAKATEDAPIAITPDACSTKADQFDLEPPYSPIDIGFAYRAPVPHLINISDTAEHLFQSPVVVCENDTPLGSAHSFHVDIVDINNNGAGRFSHFEDRVVFSASDNSDPNINGRRYSIVIPPK